MIELVQNQDVFARVGDLEIIDLTARATQSTYHMPGLSPDELGFIEHVNMISAPSARDASLKPTRHLEAAFAGSQLAGFVISTIHSPGDHELDWLMVDPAFHGTPVARRLMIAGMRWLGEDRPMWLSVARHNERAIAFYRKFGFAIDESAKTPHKLPHVLMRRDGASIEASTGSLGV